MSGRVTNPSDAFPPSVGISLDYPDGWEPLAGAGVHLAVVRIMPPGEFRPNVVATVKRMDAAFTLDSAVQQLHAKLATLPEYEQHTEERRQVLGAAGFAAEGEYTHPQAGSLAIVTAMTVVSRPNAVDLVEISGTCAAGQVEDVIEDIRGMLTGARIEKTALVVAR
ncbi:LpqN/LpqT family lipoprotein [Planctomonas psychrotolerans]|uniref:LpqN/LpqT family lipoprotein n=1 Tax=Planctomonas psychrotolerans TaxID=2528712 RepID=UPI00123AB326|nr:LpqN/LpqT family lipoprotein [Planctomonas psychrotolerans]